MNKKQIMAARIISADFTHLADEILTLRKIDESGWLHFDVMDGSFVPNITFGPPIVEIVNKVSDQFLDVHLMIEEPERHIPAFAKAGANLITVHVETCIHLNETIQLIHDNGCMAGVALKANTPMESLEWVLKDIDLVLLMTSHLGFNAQPFRLNSLDKIKQLKKMFEKSGANPYISIEGGVNQKNIENAAKVGANVFVIG